MMRREASRRRHGVRSLARWLVAGALASLSHLAFADEEYVALWGPEIGAEVPLLEASDQDGNTQTLGSLSGANGLLLVFNRSVNW